MPNAAPKTTLADTVCDQIRSDIAMRFLEPGQKINPKELAARYGVSETPVRIALNRLVSENLIEIFPRQGMCVKALNIKTCEETFQLRRMMELYYADKMVLVYRIDGSFRNKLEQNVQRHLEIMQEMSPDSSLADYWENYSYDVKFHNMLLSCASNQLLMTVYNNLNPFLYINYIYERQSKERLLSGVYEHQRILDALKSGDVDLVRKRISEHLDVAQEAIITILRISGFDK